MRARGKGSAPGRVEGSSRAMLATARPSCYLLAKTRLLTFLFSERRFVRFWMLKSFCVLFVGKRVFNVLFKFYFDGSEQLRSHFAVGDTATCLRPFSSAMHWCIYLQSFFNKKAELESPRSRSHRPLQRHFEPQRNSRRTDIRLSLNFTGPFRFPRSILVTSSRGCHEDAGRMLRGKWSRRIPAWGTVDER